MVINFRARGISRCAFKLARTFTLIKKKKPAVISYQSRIKKKITNNKIKNKCVIYQNN